MSDDKVIPLRGPSELPDPTFAIEGNERWRFCKHEKITLDEHSRTVKCSRCDKTIDPFSYLRDEVRQIQSAWDNHRRVNQMINELQGRIGELQKEEKRLKARVKTAREKLDPDIDYRTPRPL